MKRFLFLVPFSIILGMFYLFSGCACSIKNTSVVNAVPTSTNKVHYLVYYPDSSFKYLIPNEKYTSIDESIEKTITREVIKGFDKFRTVKINSVVNRDGILTIDLSDNFFEILKSYGNNMNIVVYSLVNALTELNRVKQILFLSDGEKLANSFFQSSFKRNRKYFHRDPRLSPSEVMARQMTYEQNGEWLKAYLLMSDDQNNPLRKDYNEYYKEMEDVKNSGFLAVDFKVFGYKVNKSGDKASVEVGFINKTNSSYAHAVDKYTFHTVKIDEIWMVDWLTAQ